MPVFCVKCVLTKRHHNQVRGGSVDALIVLATQTIKNDFLYQVRILGKILKFFDRGKFSGGVPNHLPHIHSAGVADC